MGQKFDSVGEDTASRPNRQKMDSGYCKILTLGTGFSGKSTLYFQVNKLNNSHEEEILKITESYVSAILCNLNDLTCEVGEIAVEKFSDKFEDPTIIDKIKFLKSLELNTFSFVKEGVDYEQTKKNHAKVLKDTNDYKLFAHIWKEPIMWEIFKSQPLLTRFDGSDYLLEKTMPKIDKDFLPTEEDIFSCRKKTTGITSIQFSHSGILFHYFDVGGQKNERKKMAKNF